MYCQKCGSQIPDDSKWCPLCGEKNNSINFYRTLLIIACFFCLLAAILFFIAGCCNIKYIFHATYLLNDPLDFLVATVTWISFGLSAICFGVFFLVLIKYMNRNR